MIDLTLCFLVLGSSAKLDWEFASYPFLQLPCSQFAALSARLIPMFAKCAIKWLSETFLINTSYSFYVDIVSVLIQLLRILLHFVWKQEKEQYKMSDLHCLIVFVSHSLAPILTVSIYLWSHMPQHSLSVFSRRAVTDILFSYEGSHCFVHSLFSF